MAQVVIVKNVRDLGRLYRATKELGDGKARRVFSHALNRVSDMGRTQIRRGLAKQTSIRYGVVIQHTRTVGSNPSNLTYRYIAQLRHFGLTHFGPVRKTQAGISAKPWKVRHRDPGTFFGDGQSGIFKRLTKKWFPIKKLWGANLAVEMTERPSDEAQRAFAVVVDVQLPRRVQHEFARMMPK